MDEEEEVTITMTRGDWMDIETHLDAAASKLGGKDYKRFKSLTLSKKERKPRWTHIIGKLRKYAKEIRDQAGLRG